MSSAHWQEVWVNGHEFGEVGIDAAIVRSCGVPVMLVTGDDKVCFEGRGLLGDTETAEVKRAVARHRTLIVLPVVAQKLIRKKARRGGADR